MKITPVDASIHLRNCHARLPFRFGITKMVAAPLCLLRVVAETPGGRVAGYASDLLVPKWFVKNPDVPIERDWLDLIAGVRGAATGLVAEGRRSSVFEHWQALAEHADRQDAPGLLRNHGPSMVERALIDVVCRSAGVGIIDAVRDDLLGLRPGDVDPALATWNLSESIGASVRRETSVRHTVGLADPLTRADVDRRVGDGLPESLDEDIQRYGLRNFKVKIAGDRDVAARLRDVGRVIAEFAGDEARITLDANEQAHSADSLADALDEASNDAHAAWLLDRVLYIEQPLLRSTSFDEDACRGIDRLARFGGCIIDEADESLDALPRAAALGYRGVSIKNCKGVIRAIVNRGRCEMSGGGLFQSGEDLTNLPIVALQQDLATMGLLGMPHVERNGHHYFDGLGFLPDADQRDAIDRHPDLYQQTPRGVQLRIGDGRLQFGSVLDCAGYGYDGPPALDDWTPVEDWTPGSLIGDDA